MLHVKYVFWIRGSYTNTMISKCIHGSWHKAMTLPYYLINTFDLTLNNLVTSIEDDLKVKKWCLLWNYFSLYLTCQIPTQGLISFLILNTTSKTMYHCRYHSLHFQLEAFYQFHFVRRKSNCKHELNSLDYYALLQFE